MQQAVPQPFVTDDVVPRATHTSLSLSSPCRAENKEQDRGRAVIDGDACIAVVCDGTTQSMYSAEAAELISMDPVRLWNGDLPALVDELRERRRLLIESAPPDEESSSFLGRAFAKIIQDARQRSFQTTFATVRITPCENTSRILVEVKACGDSGVIAFGRDGEVRFSNLPVGDGTFGHLSPLTEVLPDHFEREDVREHEVDRDTHIVVCSDGFYDAFAGPRELFSWLLEHQECSGSESALNGLHDRLDQRVGDDDITAIWLRPVIEPMEPIERLPDVEAAPLPAETQRNFRSIGRAVFGWLRRIIRRFRTEHGVA